MPWSPIPKFPEIIKNIKLKNYDTQIGREQLRMELIKVLNIINDKTIAKTIEIMCLLGWLKDSGKGSIFYICQSGPGDFPQSKKKDEKEIKDKHGI